MNIVVSLNANYLRPLCVMLRSLLDANPGEKADVYVLHASLSPEAFSFARSALPDGRLRLFDVRVPEDFMADAPVLFHFPKEMYYRIFRRACCPKPSGAPSPRPGHGDQPPARPALRHGAGEHFSRPRGRSTPSPRWSTSCASTCPRKANTSIPACCS
ncbi:MAG: hypothetical protein ACLVL7_09450 [Anaerotruncus massiliensis (ex Togo et al. 2019)]